jgi:hypothetical protein
MFARYYIELAVPAGGVEAVLLTKGLNGWLPSLIADGSAHEMRLMAEVGFAVKGKRFGRRGAVSVGEPRRMSQSMVVPLGWIASDQAGLLPKVEADLEIAPLGSKATQVSLSARYTPPLGVVGQVLDRTLMHHVAEAVVKDTTERIVAVIRERLRGSPPAPEI